MSSDQDAEIAALQWRHKYEESVRLGGVTCWTCERCGKTRSGNGCLVCVEAERESLRKALRDCATAVGATVGTECSTEFHCLVAEEVRLVVEKLKKRCGDG